MFFFKQKTAYEMRISDWSADVCSSDLRMQARRQGQPVERQRNQHAAASAKAQAEADLQQQFAGQRHTAIAVFQRPPAGPQHGQEPGHRIVRPEERREGKEDVRKSSSQWSPHQYKTKPKQKTTQTH